MRVGVLVPLKAFAGAKQRLGAALDAAARESLARSMARGVLAAAAPLPVWVVTDDEDVADWASSQGAAVVRQGRPGLNEAVTDAVAALAADGIDRVIIVHGDLPLATDLSPVCGPDGVVIVPDRHEDGTNVLSVLTRAGFTFTYGPASFPAHLAEAARLGLPVTIVRDPRLGWDVDRPDDLIALDALIGAPWTSPANRH